jgi:hypothetical protein
MFQCISFKQVKHVASSQVKHVASRQVKHVASSQVKHVASSQVKHVANIQVILSSRMAYLSILSLRCMTVKISTFLNILQLPNL